VDQVENPRSEANRSGTLSLELWALPAPYTGGRFQGHHLAGVEIGFLDGQKQWEMQPIDLAFSPPPAGAWHIVLMLRESTAYGFVTRDFASFATPFVTTPPVEKTSAKEVTKSVALVAPAAPAKEITKSVVPVALIAPAAPVKAPVKAPVQALPKGVSVNTARVEELTAVNGLTQKLAEGIVKKRPFASLDDLRKVKGLGEKILAKVRSGLKL
jgi:competence ComEA-like helix-hairpin-helix protein